MRTGIMMACACMLAAVSGCGDARVPSHELRVLPALTFQGSDGTSVTLTSHADGTDGLLVLRHGAAWCGPCQWHAEHTAELLSPDLREQVRVIDLLLADEDNAPPSAHALTAWSARAQGAAISVMDPTFELSSYFPERAAMPLIAIVDARSLTLLQTLSAPDPTTFDNALRNALANGKSRTTQRTDGRFTRDQWQMIEAMRLRDEPRDDPSNAYVADPGAVALGKRLFFDTELSSSPKRVACASCHLPDQRFQDGRDRPAQGVGLGVRNVPTVVLAPEQRWQLWDGRADSAWAQATLPFEDPDEIASSRLFIAHALWTNYRRDYEAIFGPLPPLTETARFPASGGPGTSQWDGMRESDRTLVSRVLVNVGKAIAAYERSLRPQPNALDRYAGGDLTALTDLEKDGLAAFFTAGCVQCHYGSRLTDDAFHNLRFPTGRADRRPDLGRNAGLERLARSDFTRSSVFSDMPNLPLPAAGSTQQEGAFKTPGLRGVAFTLPYGHGGSFGGLASVLEAHRSAGLPSQSPFTTGEADAALVDFDPGLVPALIAFLTALRLDLPQ